MMKACKYNALLSLFLFLFLLWCARFADARTKFLSIYCGNSNAPKTNITWVPDDDFIHNIGEKLDAVRVFRRPLRKSCYELPFIPNLPHLLRLSFSLPPSSAEYVAFNYSVETFDMLYMERVELDYDHFSENILVSADSLLHICLIRTSDCDDPSNDPSISTIELRPLEPGMYDTAKQGLTMLHKEERCDVGTEYLTRYPEDPYDRLWNYFGCYYNSFSGNNTLNASNSISIDNTKNKPPSNVMQTAVVANASDDNIYFYLKKSTSQDAVVVLYFAELNLNVKRSFSVVIDDIIRPEQIDLVGNFSAIEREFQYKGGEGAIVRLESKDGSPIINAYESYSIFTTQTPTFHNDVKALGELKKSLPLNNWTSDPCFGFPWEGINCSKIGNTIIRISQIDLSGKQLNGSIPPSLGNLTELVSLSFNGNNFSGTLPNLTSLFKLNTLNLQNNHFFGEIPNWLSKLDNLTYLSLNGNNFSGTLPNLTSLFKLNTLNLQNNHLSGKIPDWLSKLHNLTYLNISNNNFKGVIPQELLNKKNLTFNFAGNKHLCLTKKKCDDDHVTSIAAGVAGALVLTAILLGILIYRIKFKSSPSHRSPLEYLMVNVSNSSKSRSFTLHEMRTATENFSHKIGQGSFGSVFLGKLQEGKEIAVKVLSVFNKHGIDQFSNEVDLLSKINHKKLVSFLGYCICNESRDLMLVYEYMSAGSLSDNLFDPDAPKYSQLDWKNRLKIALDAAQGLEYLHIGCTPKIIHRDVKSSNILLDGNLNGKLADFGLSRVTGIGETSQINTTIKGTPGYLDPMYYRTHMLTDKSDVYSFGVVLLEVICGRKPIDLKVCPGNILLTEWVASYLGEDKDDAKIEEIVDKRLGNLQVQRMKSIVHVSNVAWRCIASEPWARPTIGEVVVNIKEAVAIEEECCEGPDELSLTSTTDFPTSVASTSGFPTYL